MIKGCLESALKEAGLTVSAEALISFECYAAELVKWNRRFNLTAICKDEDIAVKHFVDSLYIVPEIGAGECVLDLGSGAGFPAIPLKIMKPETRVISVDAVGKKIMFQRHVSRLLALRGFEAIHARAEELHAELGGGFDVVMSRAFSRLDIFAALAKPFLKDGGRLIAMKGPGLSGELRDAEQELRSAGFVVQKVQEYELPLHRGKRSLVTLVAC